MKSYTVIFLLALLVGTASAGFFQITTERVLAKQEKGKKGKKKNKKKKKKKKKRKTEAPSAAPTRDLPGPLETLCYIPRSGITFKDALWMINYPEEEIEKLTYEEAKEVIIAITLQISSIEEDFLRDISDDHLVYLLGIIAFQYGLFYLEILPTPEEPPDFDKLFEDQYFVLTEIYGYPKEQVDFLAPLEGLFWMFYISVGTMCVNGYLPE